MKPRVLDGRYQIDAPLGAGGQGRVFRGRDLVTQRPVALKLMDQGKEDDPEFVARFVQEGRLAARIRDPHLVAALHFGVADGQRYIVYDYIPGVVPLDTLLEDEGKRMPPARVCDIALQLLDTLETLHAAGVIHQDISPANILCCLRPSGRIEVFLIDLGSASSPITGGLRPAREPVGAGEFMAPEMVRDGGVCDHRVDLWSIGAVMFTLLTGCYIDLGTVEEPLEVPPPSIIIPSIPQAVSDVVMGALTSVDRRYPSAAAMMAAIQQLDLPSLPRPPPPPPRPETPVWLRLGGPASVALVAVLGTLGALRYLASSPPTAAPWGPTPAETNPDAITAKSASMTALNEENRELPAGKPLAQPTAPPDDTNSPEAPSDASPEPAPAEFATPPLEGEPPSSRREPRRVSWGVVQRAIKRKADDLDRCVSDVYVSIGVHVAQGHVTLTSINGKPASLNLPHHQCVQDVVARLRFTNGVAIDGVVGVPLAGDHTRTG